MRLDTAQTLCLLDLFGRSGDIRKFGKRDVGWSVKMDGVQMPDAVQRIILDNQLLLPFFYDEFVNSATFDLDEFSSYGDTTIGKMFKFPLTAILYMNMNDSHSQYMIIALIINTVVVTHDTSENGNNISS